MRTGFGRVTLGGFLFWIFLALTRPALAAPFAYVTNSESSSVSVIDVATNVVVTTIPVGSDPRGVTVSPAGTRVYVTNHGSNDVSVIDTTTLSVVATLRIPPPSGPLSPPPASSAPLGIAINPLGTRVYVANSIGGDVTIINTVTNTVLGSVISGSIPYGVAVHPSGNRIYVTNSGDDTVSVIDTTSNTVLTRIPVKHQPYGITVNPTGTRAYVANYGDGPNSKVSVIDTTSNVAIQEIEVALVPGSAPYGVAVHPDGTKVYVTNYAGGYVAVIDSATHTMVDTIPVGGGPIGISLSHDGTHLYVANKSANLVSVIDTATKAVIATIPVGTAPYAFGQFVSQGILWQASVSFSLKFTLVGEDTSGNVKFQTLTQTFGGKVDFFERDLVPKQITFINNDGTTAGYFRTVASVMTDTSARSDQILLIGTGDFSYAGSQGNGMAYIDAKGTFRKNSVGEVTSISLSGKVGGGVDQTTIFSGTFRATLTK